MSVHSLLNKIWFKLLSSWSTLKKLEIANLLDLHLWGGGFDRGPLPMVWGQLLGVTLLRQRGVYWHTPAGAEFELMTSYPPDHPGVCSWPIRLRLTPYSTHLVHMVSMPDILFVIIQDSCYFGPLFFSLLFSGLCRTSLTPLQPHTDYFCLISVWTPSSCQEELPHASLSSPPV